MTPTLKDLSQSCYLYFISSVDHPGWNKSAHFAQIDYGDGFGEESCVKIIYHNQWPALGNEVIGYLLARACGIETPGKAAILRCDAEFMKGELLDDYPSDAPQTGEIFAWCTTRLPNLATAQWLMLHSSNDEMARYMTKDEGGLKITALDTWLSNVDRNYKNVLMLPGGKMAAIDHEMLFNNHDWRKGNIDPPADCSILQSIRKLTGKKKISQDKYRLFLSALAEFANSHSPAYEQMRNTIDLIIGRMESNAAAQNVLDCIGPRSDKGWMPKATGLLI